MNAWFVALGMAGALLGCGDDTRGAVGGSSRVQVGADDFGDSTSGGADVAEPDASVFVDPWDDPAGGPAADGRPTGDEGPPGAGEPDAPLADAGGVDAGSDAVQDDAMPSSDDLSDDPDAGLGGPPDPGHDTPECAPWGLPFGGGDGSGAAPFLICDPAHFDNIRTQPSGAFALAADIDLSKLNFMPLGDFSGVLDGQGYVVANLRLAGNGAVSLFGYINGAVLRDLTFTDVDIRGGGNTATLAYGTRATGPATRIADVHVQGAVAGGGDFVAGLVVESVTADRFERVSFVGTVSSSGGFTAGLVRYLGADSVLRDATFEGQLSGTGWKVGGAVETFAGSLERVIVRANVTSATNRAGGVASVALVGARVSDVLFHGTVSANERVSGFIAECLGATSAQRVVAAGLVTATLRDGEALVGWMPGRLTATAVYYDRSLTAASQVAGARGLTTAELFDPSHPELDALPTSNWVRDAGTYPHPRFESP